jgi:peptide/nickel transport system permease protein
MLRFLLQRAGTALLLLTVLILIVFTLQAIAPGDPVRAYLGASSTAEAVAKKRQELGLNDDLPTRFLRYASHLIQGDMGVSLRTRRPVLKDLREFLPATVELVATAFVLALILALGFALTAALRWPGTGALRSLLFLLAAAPPFLLALSTIVLFYGKLSWFPAGGRGFDHSTPTGLLLLDHLMAGNGSGWMKAAWHLLLPALVLAISPALAIGRVLGSSMHTLLASDFVRTARAKGLRPTSVLAHHVLRNALGPALSMAGLQLGFMFAGVVVVEQVFNWPGMGHYLASSIPVSDFPAVAGITLVLGAIYIASNLAVDLLQAVADPRITA